MIRAEMISDEVVEAAAHAVVTAAYKIDPDARVNELTMEEYGALARAAIAAALNAWPGGQVRLSMFTPQEEIILPLPAEANDE